jgi:glyoxylase-like metal-dependent hydrolase (beta-lactamase superfamily II)
MHEHSFPTRRSSDLVDHVLGTNFLTTSFSIKAYLPESEKKIYDEMVNYAHLFGFENYNNSKDIKYITKDSKLVFNGLDIDIFLLPGHSPGHLAFYFDRDKKCFSGDVIFKNSIGRTDLPGGNYEILIIFGKPSSLKTEDESIKEILKSGINFKKLNFNNQSICRIFDLFGLIPLEARQLWLALS